MRMKLIDLNTLEKGDTFFNVDPAEDGQGNIYLSQSKFTVSEAKYHASEIVNETNIFTLRKLIVIDEEGREINTGITRNNNNSLIKFGRIYKSFY